MLVRQVLYLLSHSTSQGGQMEQITLILNSKGYTDVQGEAVTLRKE
jgi:hypothetical protein